MRGNGRRRQASAEPAPYVIRGCKPTLPGTWGAVFIAILFHATTLGLSLASGLPLVLAWRRAQVANPRSRLPGAPAQQDARAAHKINCGGGAWESNPPRTGVARPADGFEDREAHRDPSASTLQSSSPARAAKRPRHFLMPVCSAAAMMQFARGNVRTCIL